MSTLGKVEGQSDGGMIERFYEELQMTLPKSQKIYNSLNAEQKKILSEKISGIIVTVFDPKNMEIILKRNPLGDDNVNKLHEIINLSMNAQNMMHLLKPEASNLVSQIVANKAELLQEDAMNPLLTALRGLPPRDFRTPEARGKALEQAVRGNDLNDVNVLLSTEIPENEIEISLTSAFRLHQNPHIIFALLTYGLPIDRTEILEEAVRIPPNLGPLLEIFTASEVSDEIKARLIKWLPIIKDEIPIYKYSK